MQFTDLCHDLYFLFPGFIILLVPACSLMDFVSLIPAYQAVQMALYSCLPFHYLPSFLCVICKNIHCKQGFYMYFWITDENVE